MYSFEMENFKSCKRYNDPGHAHELTFSCFDKRPYLQDDFTCEFLANSINMTRERYNLDVWAYVFMPDHVHLLIYPNSVDYNVSLILKSIKQSTSQKIKSRVQNSGLKLTGLIENLISGKEFRFWQRGGGYDRNIYEMNPINPIIEYIHNNPVRKGWVDKPEDWKWSSAGFYIEGKKSIVIIDKENMNRRMI